MVMKFTNAWKLVEQVSSWSSLSCHVNLSFRKLTHRLRVPAGMALLTLRGLACVKGQSRRVHEASNLQFGWMYRHLSPNLQLGKDLKSNQTRGKKKTNHSSQKTETKNSFLPAIIFWDF
jgi:hypothetical protein